ncbi:MAG TPA: glycoside hydrolase [Paludibacter sp.]
MKTTTSAILISLFIVSAMAVKAAPDKKNNKAANLIQTIEVNTSEKGEPLVHFWSVCFGAGRANEGLRAGWQNQLKTVKENCGMGYIRFHGLFHDDMFVYREINGKSEYNWQYVDDLYDRLLAKGVRPFVELSFFPAAMSDGEGTVFWWKAHSKPPKDLTKWSNLVKNFTQHCVDRYGIDEVRKWYFEVWNEPNLDYFFNGTMDDYFQIYKVSANAVKSVDNQLRIGGPATTNFTIDKKDEFRLKDMSQKTKLTLEDLEKATYNGNWVREMLAFCKKENLPVDFISCHPYPTHFPLDMNTSQKVDITRSVNSVKTDMKWLHNIIAESAYPNVEIHLTEWSSSPSPRDYTHDYPQEATYIVKINIDCIGLVNSLAYWTFTDIFEEGGGAWSVFHGGFGLLNFQGIPKPAFHAYRFLNQLGNQIIFKKDNYIFTKDSLSQMLSGIIYNYPAEIKTAIPMSRDSNNIAEKTLQTSNSIRSVITLKKLKPNSCFQIEILDKDHGFAFRKWEEMGSPQSPDREQTKILIDEGWKTEKRFITADKEGVLTIQIDLKPWAVALIKEI